MATKDVQDSVRQGESIAGPLTEHEVFPPMVVQMIAVGEETGQVDTMLEKIAEFYDQEVEAMTEALTSLMEPLMIAVLGASWVHGDRAVHADVRDLRTDRVIRARGSRFRVACRPPETFFFMGLKSHACPVRKNGGQTERASNGKPTERWCTQSHGASPPTIIGRRPAGLPCTPDQGDLAGSRGRKRTDCQSIALIPKGNTMFRKWREARKKRASP
jgi:hypothetical protein